MPRVSVVIPTLNTIDFIEEALNSTLCQSFSDIEIIVVDSESDDGTREFLDGIDDNRLRVLDVPRGTKVGVSRNTGIDAAQGEFIAIMDGDDIMHPRRIERQVEALDAQSEIDLIGSSFLAFGENWSESRRQPKYDPQIKARLLLANGSGLHDPTVTMRREFLEVNGLSYPSERSDSDIGLWLACMKKGATFANHPDELLKYRKHSGSITANKAEDFWDKKAELRAAYLAALFDDLSDEESMALGFLMTFNRPSSLAGLVACDRGFSKIEGTRSCGYGASADEAKRLLSRLATTTRKHVRKLEDQLQRRSYASTPNAQRAARVQKPGKPPLDLAPQLHNRKKK